jgi:hypothetical protein
VIDTGIYKKLIHSVRVFAKCTVAMSWVCIKVDDDFALVIPRKQAC